MSTNRDQDHQIQGDDQDEVELRAPLCSAVVVTSQNLSLVLVKQLTYVPHICTSNISK